EAKNKTIHSVTILKNVVESFYLCSILQHKKSEIILDDELFSIIKTRTEGFIEGHPHQTEFFAEYRLAFPQNKENFEIPPAVLPYLKELYNRDSEDLEKMDFF